jgi:hypothetical protein
VREGLLTTKYTKNTKKCKIPGKPLKANKQPVEKKEPGYYN